MGRRLSGKADVGLEIAGLEGQLELQAHLGVIQRHAEDVLDFADMVQDGISVHVQQSADDGGPALVFQIDPQQVQRVGIVLLIVFPQRGDGAEEEGVPETTGAALMPV